MNYTNDIRTVSERLNSVSKNNRHTGMEEMVFSTTAYHVFKPLAENRKHKRSHIESLKESIKQRGQLVPIHVDSNMNVSDGNGRLIACMELGIPIDYVIVRPRTVEETREMNNVLRKWNTEDYVYSYAKSGKPDYELLLSESKRTGLPIIAIAAIMTGTKTYIGGWGQEKVKNGTFKISNINYKQVLRDIEILIKINSRIKLTSSIRPFLVLYFHPKFDFDTWMRQVRKRYIVYNNVLNGAAKWDSRYEEFKAIYNYGLTEKNRIS